MSSDLELPEVDQPALFDVAPDCAPSGEKLRLLVHFLTPVDRLAFSRLIGQRVVESTRSISYPVAGRLPPEYLDAHVSQDVEALDLIKVDSNWQEAWRGMPAYSHRDMTPCHTISAYFDSEKDRQAFAKLIDHHVLKETKFVWFPRAEPDVVAGIRWRSTRPQNPKYPVYVPTKGRWDSAMTIKCLESLRVPYFAVVQPQEKKYYEQVVETGVMLTLPEGLDGLVPTRNWIFEHAVASGADRHWQLDDNIKEFFRYHENRQIRVADGTCLRVAEDFADRYENVAIAGFQYFMFVKRKFGNWPPYVFNTRVYSNSLINNRMPFRYRDVYNDDTDICLRAMKAGWCTVQFNAFLAWKQPTMVVKGGNTPIYLGAEAVAEEWMTHARECKSCSPDESPDCQIGRAILQKDGRWRMADSLKQQHPDVTIVGRRWNRWQHYVDYRQFKRNVPTLRQGVAIADGPNDYGLELVDVPQTDKSAKATSDNGKPAPAPSVTSGPSALAFAFRQAEPQADVPSAPPVGLEEAPAPEGKPVLASPGQPEQASEPDPNDRASATTFAIDLKARGHRLLTRDGKFFVSDAGRLTDADRVAIKVHREALVAMAEAWIEPAISVDAATAVERCIPTVAEASASPTLFEEPRTTQTLVQFLGTASPRSSTDYVANEPPDLTGIHEVVLNFATTGLNWHGGDRPCGVTVSTLDGQLCRFLPFAFAGGNLDEATVKRWAERELRGKKITNSKTKFDIHHAREWGVDLEEQGCTFSDIQHTAALLDDHRKRFSLDILAADYFPGEQFAARLDETQHHRFSAEQAEDREKDTARLVGRLRAAMYPEIDKQDLRRVQDLEDGVIPAVVEMERNGSPIDEALLEQYGRECNAARDALLWEISKECGFAFEHTATGWKRLIESLNLPVPDSFSESVLNEVDHPLVRKGQRASQYASLNSKIFKAYPEHIVDGILRYNINQLASDDGGTVSGRFSIGIVQQVPNEYNHSAIFGDELFPRRLFIPGSGEYLEGDAAQIEFRLLVHYSENAKLLQAYRDDPWMSFHKKMQEMLIAYKSDMNYTHTKSYNFAAQYGARSIKLAVMMGFITERIGEEIRKAKRWDDPRLKTIKEIEAAYARAHPEASALLDRASHLMKNECDKYCHKGDALHRQFPHRGYVKTMLGRRSRCVNNYKPYIGLNRVLQGTGASIMKRKLIELHAERKNTGFVMRITNHDAVLGDATTPETLRKVSAILNAQSYPFKVPILWECGVGRDWGSVVKS